MGTRGGPVRWCLFLLLICSTVQQVQADGLPPVAIVSVGFGSVVGIIFICICLSLCKRVVQPKRPASKFPAGGFRAHGGPHTAVSMTHTSGGALPIHAYPHHFQGYPHHFQGYPHSSHAVHHSGGGFDSDCYGGEGGGGGFDSGFDGGGGGFGSGGFSGGCDSGGGGGGGGGDSGGGGGGGDSGGGGGGGD